MNRYETIVVIDADVGDDEKRALMERLESQISRRNGELVEFDEWGMRKLAYEIRKKKQGQYVRIDFCGNGETVSAIERTLGHDHRILRFMTVRLAENIDPETLRAQSAEEEKDQEAGQTEAETETAQSAEPTEAAETPAADAETAETARATGEEE